MVSKLNGEFTYPGKMMRFRLCASIYQPVQSRASAGIRPHHGHRFSMRRRNDAICHSPSRLFFSVQSHFPSSMILILTQRGETSGGKHGLYRIIIVRLQRKRECSEDLRRIESKRWPVVRNGHSQSVVGFLLFLYHKRFPACANARSKSMRL